jgi:hypothetical protein
MNMKNDEIDLKRKELFKIYEDYKTLFKEEFAGLALVSLQTE